MPNYAPATEVVNYFFYKCGEANCWLPVALKGHGLYVGFGDSPSSAPTGNPWIATREPEATFRARTGEDDDNIAWLTHPSNRSWFLLLTFSESDLIFWEVSDKLQVHRPGSEAFELADTLWRKFPAKSRETYKHIFGPDTLDPVFKTLPAAKVAAVPRRELYASIDSLAVYQFLNRGTCRPIWRIQGPTEAEMPPLIAGQSQASVRGRDKQGKETNYAAFVRLYLNSALARALGHTLPSPFPRLTGQPALASFWMSMSALHQQQLVLTTANPILVETAALYFCLDLGLIADIGSGKGIDVIDVRARAESQRAADRAAELLAGLQAEGIVISEAVRNRLRTERVLEIQCKAADRKFDSKNIIYFGYRRKAKSETNTAPMTRLAQAFTRDPWRQGLLKRFLAMQEQIVSNTACEQSSEAGECPTCPACT
jgi:hypothetical protein